MHDPSVLLFDVRALKLDVWHDEPGGHDSPEVCGHHPLPIGQRILWAGRHIRHLRLRWWPYLNVRRWIVDRCDHCGQRVRWKDARHSYQSTDKVWHDVCMSLRTVRGQLDDLTGMDPMQAYSLGQLTAKLIAAAEARGYQKAIDVLLASPDYPGCAKVFAERLIHLATQEQPDGQIR